MSGVSLVAFIGVLGAVLLLVMALMAWQEAKSRSSSEGPMYVIEDAVDHVLAGLPEDTDLGRADVLRILEYEIFYLQGLAQEDRREPVETVAGGTPASVQYIGSQIAERHGAIYAQEEIEQVLSLEASYLAKIGALGDAVTEIEEEAT